MGSTRRSPRVPPAPPAPAWHAWSPARCADELRADVERGLSEEEVRERRARGGVNDLPSSGGESAWRRWLSQFWNLMSAVLAVAAALAWLVGEPIDALAILAILLLNALLSGWQEQGAARSLAALRRLAAPRARVRRAGHTQMVPAADLVLGDLVIVEAGDRVPADLRLLGASGLLAVEATLTGEPEPVVKRAEVVLEPEADLADRVNLLHMGTAVAAGEGRALVVAVGAGTELGHIALLVRGEREPATPLERRLAAFGHKLVLGSVCAVGLVLLLGLLRQHPWQDMLLTAVGMGVAAVPEGLPAVVTVTLALGVGRMARRGALVRRLSAVETLGSTSVLCTDKTGTLTEGRMRVRSLWTPQDEAEVEGSGYTPARAFLGAQGARTLVEGEPLHALLHAAVASSTARLVEREGQIESVGDPTEGALLAAAAGAGVLAERLDAEEPVVVSLPFDADRRRMAIVRRSAGELVSYVKGAPEALLERLEAEPAPGAPAHAIADSSARARAWNEAQGERGRRVLAVACRVLSPGDERSLRGQAEERLELLGLVALDDPPRPQAAAALARCRSAGLRVVMITGDQPATALAVARVLGIASGPEEVLTGAEIERLDEAALTQRMLTTRVCARTSPAHKLRLVRALRAAGQVVAMTGDGVNDAPALKAADIGVAMGKTGTDVARDASSMVLLDDDISTLVAAVEEGRRIHENVRKSLLYLLAGNAGELLVMATAVLVGLPLPLLPLQLLWINLVTDGLPALALATDPADADLLARPPRKPDEPFVDRAFLRVLTTSALLSAGVVLGVFACALAAGATVPYARSQALLTLVTEEILRAFVVRSRTRTAFEVGLFTNARLFVVGAASLALQVGLAWIPSLGALLGVVPLRPLDTLLCVAAGALPATVLELTKLGRRAARRSSGRGD